MDAYLDGGFDALLAPPQRPRAQTLSPQRRKILRFILLYKTPAEYGFDGYQGTARRVQALLEQKWQLHLSLTRLYEIFDELHLSHQRAHRDYGPARPGERARFLEALKKTSTPRPTPPSSPSTNSP